MKGKKMRQEKKGVGKKSSNVEIEPATSQSAAAT